MQDSVANAKPKHSGPVGHFVALGRRPLAMGRATFTPMAPEASPMEYCRPEGEQLRIISARRDCRCTRRRQLTVVAIAFLALIAAGAATWYFLITVIVPKTLTAGVSISSFEGGARGRTN